MRARSNGKTRCSRERRRPDYGCELLGGRTKSKEVAINAEKCVIEDKAFPRRCLRVTSGRGRVETFRKNVAQKVAFPAPQ
jgi:hypothetical protein